MEPAMTALLRAAFDDLPGLIAATVSAAVLVAGLHYAPEIARLMGGI
jgi:hypothetical protein